MLICRAMSVVDVTSMSSLHVPWYLIVWPLLIVMQLVRLCKGMDVLIIGVGIWILGIAHISLKLSSCCIMEGTPLL